MRPIVGIACAIIFTTALFLIFSCATAPTNPCDISNTTITLYAQSSSGVISASSVEDTVGNIVKIGAQCNLWNYVDSIQFRQVVQTATIVKDSILGAKAGVSTLKYTDTVWQSAVFNEMGTKKIEAMAYLNNGRIVYDTVNVVIYSSPAINLPPAWQKDTINEVGRPGNAITISLSDKCADADGDTLYFSLLSGLPAGDAIANPTANASYTFTPGPVDTGVYYPRIVAKDPKGLADTLTIVLNIRAPNIDSLPPAIILLNPSKDTVIGSDSCEIQVKCTDASGIISVVCSLGTQTFNTTRSAPIDSIFSATVKGLTPGAFSTITITATDASTAHNTATVTVKIKYDNDRTKPVVSLFDPIKDSLPINANSYAVKVVSKDSSGVASVVYRFGTTSFPATKTSDSVWVGTISGLVSGALNKIMVVATDASINANKDTVSFFIKYDPTMTDLTGPVFFPKSGPANNAIVVDSGINIVDSIYDPSGVDSVYWTLNGKNPKTLTLVAGATYSYSLADTLHRYHLDTITINAQDKSTNRNKSSQTIILNYNVPPVINDTAVSTNRNVAKTWTLNALSVDDDPLTWTRITSPSALSGTVTGTLPSVTFTPAANWSGVDSFMVRVTDGHWSDTAQIKITVANVTVAPGIVTPPESATKNVGQSVTFSVGINTDVNPDPSYQWKHNGNNITTATSPSFTIGSIAVSDSGSYTVVVANSADTVTSQAAILTVNYAPLITRQPQSMQIVRIGDSISLSIAATGSPSPKYQWFRNGSALTGKTDSLLLIKNIQRGDSATYYVSVTNTVQNILSHDAVINVLYVIAANAGSSIFFFTNDGALWGCGSNWMGQIGDGTKNNVLKPKQIMTDAVSVSNNAYNTLMLKKDGSLWGCGDNSLGQLGDTLTNSYLTPKQVAIGPISEFSSGTSRTFYAINTFGLYALWSCGKNYSGALGNGTINDSKIFSQVPNLTDISTVCAGFGNSAFILTNTGILWAWGDNSHGQLGDSTLSDKVTPEQVMTNVTVVTAGQWHTVILGTNGTLYGFGDNSFGQLGSLPQTNIKIPTQIPGMTGIIAVSAGNMHTLILKNDNSEPVKNSV